MGLADVCLSKAEIKLDLPAPLGADRMKRLPLVVKIYPW
jgi:hypothetical protein